MATSRPSTLVRLNKPVPKAPVVVQDLSVGTYFSLINDDKIYVKTDETLARGYRCLVASTGTLEAIDRNAFVNEVYKKVTINVE